MEYFDINIKNWKCRCVRSIKSLLQNTETEFEKNDDGKRNGVHGPFLNVGSSKNTRVCKASLKYQGKNLNVYIKEFYYRSFVDRIKHLVRPSRAKRAFNAGLMLEKNNIKTPAVISVFEKSLGLITTKNCLITKSINDANGLHCYFNLNRQGKLTPEWKRHFIKQLGNAIGKMHARGISHGDLRSGNILCKKENSEWQFYLMDNERTVKYKKLPMKLRLKNLVQINMILPGHMSNIDRARFFNAYLKQNPGLKKNKKQIAAQILDLTADRMANKLLIPLEKIQATFETANAQIASNK